MRSRTLLIAAGLTAALAAAAGCAPADDDPVTPAASGGSTSAAVCAPAGLKTVARGQAHHRAPTTRSTSRGSWTTSPSNGKGFEARRRLRGGHEARLQQGPGRPGPGSRSTTRSRRRRRTRLRHQRVLDHRRAQAGRRLLRAVLRRDPGGHRVQGSKIAGAKTRGRPQGRQARRPGRHDQLPRHHRGDQAADAAAGVQQQRRRQEGPARTARSTVSSWTCRPRSTSPAPRSTTAQIVGQLPQPSGTPEQFGLVLDKGSPLTGCVSQAVDALRADGTLETLTDSGCRRVQGAPVARPELDASDAAPARYGRTHGDAYRRRHDDPGSRRRSRPCPRSVVGGRSLRRRPAVTRRVARLAPGPRDSFLDLRRRPRVAARRCCAGCGSTCELLVICAVAAVLLGLGIAHAAHPAAGRLLPAARAGRRVHLHLPRVCR